MRFNKNLVTASILAASFMGYSLQANAAQVPEGVVLADKQVLVRGNGSEPATLDPNLVEGVPGGHVVRDLFEGLVSSGPNGETLPAAATSWETADNKTFLFNIRKDAKWSDGSPVTAHDYVYAWQRGIDPALASTYSWYFEKTSMLNAKAIVKGDKAPDTLGVSAVDDHTLKVELEKPVPYFVSMLSHYTMLPVSKSAIEKHGSKWTRPGNIITNGAYQLDKWVVNERIDLKRNPHYWNDKETVVNKVSFLPIVSHNSDMNRFLADEVHLTYEIPIEHFKRLKKENPDEVRVTGYVGTYYYQFMTKKKPFDDVRVRKALSYSINRDAIANYIMGQGEKPAYSFTPSIVDGFTPSTPEWATWSQKERDAKALALLKEAGYDKNNPLKFELLYNTNENHKKVAIAVASMWKKNLGVQAELVNQEWKTYLATKTQGDFEVARAGWIADYNEASSMLDLLHSTHGNNDGKYANSAYDKFMDESRSVTDTDKRGEYYQNAEAILEKDMPVAPIYQYVQARLVKNYVGGFPNNPLDNLYSKDMYLIKK